MILIKLEIKFFFEVKLKITIKIDQLWFNKLFYGKIKGF